MAESFWVEVVAADALVWEGEATVLNATTTEGEIGILAHHVPIIATLAPGSTAEVLTSDGNRLLTAVDGGFLAVSLTRAAIISPYAQLADGIDIDQARSDLRSLQAKREQGDNSAETEMAYRRALAQVKTADRLEAHPSSH
ncbi:MAG: F0F1 ATP synthase subunit epsilon [Propionibacteriaceae bacterium]|jgi:F-type H+-transporting ATPase subunit epsilon|nr:F0F1 ATP synthase subunit epsilon [Propionibacteriaceae bacterium]